MLERGDVSKIKNFILPKMPRCYESSVFESAKLADVFSAFIMVMFIMGVSFGMSKILVFKFIKFHFKKFNYPS